MGFDPHSGESKVSEAILSVHRNRQDYSGGSELLLHFLEWLSLSPESPMIGVDVKPLIVIVSHIEFICDCLNQAFGQAKV
jgi:hypothetical protein